MMFLIISFFSTRWLWLQQEWVSVRWTRRFRRPVMTLTLLAILERECVSERSANCLNLKAPELLQKFGFWHEAEYNHEQTYLLIWKHFIHSISGIIINFKLNHKIYSPPWKSRNLCQSSSILSFSHQITTRTPVHPPLGASRQSLGRRREHPNCSMSHRKSKALSEEQALVAWAWCSQSKGSTHHVSMWLYRMINLSGWSWI